MKKLFSSKIFIFILGALILGGIGVYAEYKIYARNINYGDTTVKDALDTLYSRQNTTISNLNSEVSSLNTQVSSLTAQVSSLNSQLAAANTQVTTSDAKANKAYTTHFTYYPSQVPYNFTTNFRPNYIVCNFDYNETSVVYNKDSSSTNVWVSGSGFGVLSFPVSTFYTITDTGFSYNYVDSNTNYSGRTVYCFAAK